MSEIELAWAAGFFDGEGCSFVKRSKGHSTLCVQLAQSGKDVPSLTRFVAAVGRGRLYGPYVEKARLRRTPQVRWTSHGQEALDVLRMLWPHLSDPKRDQAQAAIEAWDADLKRATPRRSDARRSVSLSQVERTLECQS